MKKIIKVLTFLLPTLVFQSVFAQTFYAYRIPTDKKCDVIYYFSDKYDSKKEEGKKYTWSGKCGPNNLIEGYGTLIELYPDGSRATTTATYINGKEEGSGTEIVETSRGKRVFNGTFKDGWKYHGTQTNDTYSVNSKSIYEGSFYNGKFAGNGSYLFKRPEPIYRYEGNFTNGKFDGRGRMYWYETRVSWVGNFTNGKKNGTGTLYGEDGSTELVQFANDEEVYRQ